MAHDNQYKDSDGGLRIVATRQPQAGERYWNPVEHRVVTADHDLMGVYQIVEMDE